MISVIIPVYNTPVWLIKRTLKSVCTQKDVQIIVVDDGSDDSEVLEFLASISSKNKYQVIRKANGGLGSARNEGLKYATGEYISFIDSDDFIDDNFYSKLYELAKNNDADIVSALMVETDGKRFSNMDSCNDLIATELEDKIKHIECGSVCNKLIRKTLFEDIRFPENGIFWEDNAVLLELCIKSNVVVFTTETKYFYWFNPISITKNKKFLTKRMNDSLIVLNMIKKLSLTVRDEDRKLIISKFLPILFNSKYYKMSKNYRKQIHNMFTEDELKCIPVSEKIIFKFASIALVKRTPIIDVECDVMRKNRILCSVVIRGRKFCLIKYIKNYMGAYKS